MRPPALVVLVALGLAPVLASCGPKAAEQADICAIFALPAIPGDTVAGDAADLAWAKVHERALFKSGVIYGPGWQVMGHRRAWGHCPVRPKPVEHLLISPDRAYAMTKGGRRAGGKPVSFGACYFEKRSGAWSLRACRKTLNEPVPLMTAHPLGVSK